MTNDKKKIVGIFQTGEGGDRRFYNTISEMGLYKPEFITADNIKNNALNKIDKLILPGCRSGQETYRTPLGNKGFAKIQTAVYEHGLQVLGVCGGAYVVSEEIDWYYQGEKKVVTSPHALFKGKCAGPIAPYRGGEGALPFLTQKICLSDNIRLENWPENLDIIYWGGGDFDWNTNTPQNIKTLYYREFDQKPAIIRFNLGKGLVTLSNVHPEASYQNIMPSDSTTMPLEFFDNLGDISAIQKTLQENEKQRYQLLKKLIT